MKDATPRTWVFIPTFNVARRILEVLDGIPACALARIERVLVIDNQSRDETVELVRAWIARHPQAGKFKLYRNRRNHSLGGSAIVAFRLALAGGAEYLITLHGDGQADPRALTTFIDRSRGGADILLGSRFLAASDVADYPWWRRLGNLAFIGLQQLLLKNRMRDIGAYLSFKLSLIRDLPYARLPSDMGYHPMLVLLACRARPGLRYEEFAVRWGAVETSNVAPVRYALTHLARLARAATGRLALTDRRPEDFESEEVSPW